MSVSVKKSDFEWKKNLTDEEYRILREKGTEQPFTGLLLHNKKPGIYVCRACGNSLFRSDAKFDSKSGWPSFWDVISSSAIDLQSDSKYGMNRVEVICKSCGSHLGHLFNDGPKPTGRRYCINSISLRFIEKK